MVKFNLVKNAIEIKKRNDSRVIKRGVTLERDDQFPEIIKDFDNKEEALKALDELTTTIHDYGLYYRIEEYYVEEVIIITDEYGEEVEINDGIWALSKLPKNWRTKCLK